MALWIIHLFHDLCFAQAYAGLLVGLKYYYALFFLGMEILWRMNFGAGNNAAHSVWYIALSLGWLEDL